MTLNLVSEMMSIMSDQDTPVQRYEAQFKAFYIIRLDILSKLCRKVRMVSEKAELQVYVYD